MCIGGGDKGGVNFMTPEQGFLYVKMWQYMSSSENDLLLISDFFFF